MQGREHLVPSVGIWPEEDTLDHALDDGAEKKERKRKGK
jgi:hypothetical protein